MILHKIAQLAPPTPELARRWLDLAPSMGLTLPPSWWVLRTDTNPRAPGYQEAMEEFYRGVAEALPLQLRWDDWVPSVEFTEFFSILTAGAFANGLLITTPLTGNVGRIVHCRCRELPQLQTHHTASLKTWVQQLRAMSPAFLPEEGGLSWPGLWAMDVVTGASGGLLWHTVDAKSVEIRPHQAPGVPFEVLF